MTLIWLKGMLTRRGGRLAATALGVATAVALLAALGSFLAASKATMTSRTASSNTLDWQVQVAAGSDPATVLAAVAGAAGTDHALPVEYADTSGLTATVGGSTQTTGAGTVLGLPDNYAATFPGQIRQLTGASTGVLVAQQTAANLHVGPGDTVAIGRSGLAPVTVTIAGVVDLPHADSLFQKVGAPAQSQPAAPPDNVLLLPARQFHAVFDPLAAVRPDLVSTQVHASRSHVLPADPAAAYAAEIGAAHNVEATLAGSGQVGDNLGTALDGARQDALYAQILFLFLGVPGAALAGLLTSTVTSTGAGRRRREQALLRTRGATAAQLIRLASVEAGLVAVVGGAVGLGTAALIGRIIFGSAAFGASSQVALLWAVAAFAAGAAVAVGTILLPARREAREESVAAGRAVVGRTQRPRWMRYWLDLLALAAAALVYRATSGSGYSLVLAPEGIPQLSVNYWAFTGPALLWIGSGLLAWRLADLLLRRGRPFMSVALRPLAGGLAATVAASLARQRRTVVRAVVLLALAVTFASSTAVFNSTYQQQAEVDAKLTSGADVTVTESPGVTVGPAAAAALATVPGVRSVEPLQHRFAYVGSDLQDLYGVRPSTVVSAGSLQDAYFQGGTAQGLIGSLASKPDGVLVSAETVKDFQLQPGDRLNLRLQDGRTKQFTTVPFHYIGVVTEFPTAPKDSFFVANADYVAAQTGSAAVGTFLVDTGGRDQPAVAQAIQRMVGTSAAVTDLTTSRAAVASSLTSVDLSGLTRVELSFAVVLSAAAGGLVLALGLAERRRTFALARALGASRSQLRGFLGGEAAVVITLGLAAGALTSIAMSQMLVTVLTGVFDPPPAALAVPWVYLAAMVAVAVAAIAVATGGFTRQVLARSTTAELREL